MRCWSAARAPITWEADELLADPVGRAAHRRFVQISQRRPVADHPVHPAIPETRYLKAFFCRVTRE
jgi:23S rRNA G2069 N7-methylase RlmK/C1962 C5-methylase RlmI